MSCSLEKRRDMQSSDDLKIRRVVITIVWIGRVVAKYSLGEDLPSIYVNQCEQSCVHTYTAIMTLTIIVHPSLDPQI